MFFCYNTNTTTNNTTTISNKGTNVFLAVVKKVIIKIIFLASLKIFAIEILLTYCWYCMPFKEVFLTERRLFSLCISIHYRSSF
ncbi:MAG: hypothetical protein ACTSXH_17525 [Promethearchaeota archaeon]